MNPFEESKKYFDTPLQEFVFYDKYSRYRYDLGRRESWTETVERAVSFLKELSQNKLEEQNYDKIKNAILNMQVMPSMRLMAMAGDAARRNNLAIYNCSYVNMDSIESIVEIMTLSMAGVGVGYSVRNQHINQLPKVPAEINETANPYTIEDTSEGWADALRYHLNELYSGGIVTFDYSQIRPHGSPLKVKGGRASGPEVLKECLDFISEIFLDARGRKLKSIEVHDIACCIGYCSISGGVRRTALISLFDLDDEDMLHAKNGDEVINYRWYANNSGVWDDEPTEDQFNQQMDALFDGGRGEPGIFSLKNSRDLSPPRRNSSKIEGLNPCGEVLLRNMQTCNLTSVICRPDDTIEDLTEKVIIASVIGTIQSMADNFPTVRPEWIENQQEERLLGVDLSGQMDCPLLRNDVWGHYHEFLREIAVETNKKVANKLGINESASVTCVKPNGNSSQLVNSSSGLHPRHSKYYRRNVRVSTSSPVYKVLKDCGVPMSPENGETEEDMKTAVVHFPVKSPDGAITADNVTAIDMCNFWKINKLYYTEMNPSVTVQYDKSEEGDLREWIWRHRTLVGGMAFLPKLDAKYNNMPYETITEDEYNKAVSEFPEIDWSLIEDYEKEDMTTIAQEVACLAGVCEI